MSSEDDLHDHDASNMVTRQILSKKRKVQRACDICRRKKIRCDGGEMPGNRCTNCITYDFQCTYVESAKKRGPPKGYVENLENRLEKIQTLLHRLMPDADFTKDLDISDSDRLQAKQSMLEFATNMISQVGTTERINDVPSDDDAVILPDTMQPVVYNQRFFGKSSGAMLLQHALTARQEYTGVEHSFAKLSFLGERRPEYWGLHPWESSLLPATPQCQYTFPEPDLMQDLIDLYFEHINILNPLLHRPIFHKNIQEKLHCTNDAFGAVLLLVCAVAARYSDDPRVFLEGTNSTHSCGWKWFDQVPLVRKSLLAAPTLYDLQVYCLSVQFLTGTSAPQACWTMVGIGIRLAQDVGAHRRKTYHGPPSIEQELWKRAWVLVAMDRSTSSALGRPCATQDEDFDVGLPIECDDEYFDHPDPEKAWKQPAGVPSKVAYFNCMMKLNQILSMALRTIYAINKSKVCLSFDGTQWEQQIVSGLDSALNQWVDSIPEHLKWDPNRENLTWFRQSVTLYASYYHLQILIHRPFIPSPRKPSPLSFPSLAICTNAARSTSHIVDLFNVKCHHVMINIQMPVFTAAIVLLLNIWGGKRAGLTTDPSKEMKDVYKCMEILQLCEERWQSAGRLWDIIYELASVGELPLPNGIPRNKRGREEEESTLSSPGETNSHSSCSDSAPRTFASNRRVASTSTQSTSLSPPSLPQQPPQQAQQPRSTTASSSGSSQFDMQLPLYSNDLARLPIHGQLSFGGSAAAPGPSSTSAGTKFMAAGSMNRDWRNASFIPPDLSNYISPGNMFFGTPPGDVTASNFGGPAAMVYGDGSGMDDSVGSPGKRAGAGVETSPGYRQQPQELHSMIDQDTLAMWSSAPSGFELDDWGAYLSTVSELQSMNGTLEHGGVQEQQQHS